MKNQGEALFRGWVTIEIQLSPDGQWSDASPVIQKVKTYVAPLRVGQKRALSFALLSIPKGIGEGNYHIAAKITLSGEEPAATANNTAAGWRTTFTGQAAIAKSKPNPEAAPAGGNLA